MSALPEFQQYQLAFTAHIRQPTLNGKPAKVPNARMAVYRNAIFNNFLSIVSACFPVTQQVLGARAWKKLVRRFVAEHATKTPIFKDIPYEFVQYLATLKDVPPYLQALTHYEWVELEVSHQPLDDARRMPDVEATLNLLDEIPQFAAHQLLAYDYPVHKISKKQIPDTITPTFLLVYRNQNFEIKFIALNPVTYRLLSLLKEQPRTGRQALMVLAQELQQAPDSIIQFGEGILHELAEQQVFIGSIKGRQP
jgi:hypothetical protein